MNGNLRELSYKIDRDCDITPINMTTSDGSKIYRRSLTFLLQTAFHEIFPKAFLAIDHSVPNGGYYCKMIDRDSLSEAEIVDLENKMKELVSEDLPIIKEKVPLDPAAPCICRRKNIHIKINKNHGAIERRIET